MNNLTEAEKAYIAGFVDGEGNIAVVMCKNKNYKFFYQFRPIFQITNTNLEVLERIRNLLGVGCINYRKQKNSKWKQAYILQIWDKNARDVIQSIFDYLIVKKEQAEKVLSFPMSCKGSKRTEEEYREQIKNYSYIRILNKRGSVITTLFKDS